MRKSAKRVKFNNKPSDVRWVYMPQGGFTDSKKLNDKTLFAMEQACKQTECVDENCLFLNKKNKLIQHVNKPKPLTSDPKERTHAMHGSDYKCKMTTTERKRHTDPLFKTNVKLAIDKLTDDYGNDKRIYLEKVAADSPRVRKFKKPNLKSRMHDNNVSMLAHVIHENKKAAVAITKSAKTLKAAKAFKGITSLYTPRIDFVYDKRNTGKNKGDFINWYTDKQGSIDVKGGLVRPALEEVFNYKSLKRAEKAKFPTADRAKHNLQCLKKKCEPECEIQKKKIIKATKKAVKFRKQKQKLAFACAKKLIKKQA